MDQVTSKPFGHSVRVVRSVRLAKKKPLDPGYREETIEVRRRGSRRTLERAIKLTRGFIRVEGEVETYTRDEWRRRFGSGNERCREDRRIAAWRRAAKTAQNAFEDLMNACRGLYAESTPIPKDAVNSDDWKRMQRWEGEVVKARNAADAAEARLRKKR